ncbi:response regulator transcription factor [bacterium]|nr:response regulator transcription factor [bacterium]
MSEVRPHVLIIEDDPEIAALLELHISDQNYDVTHVGDGQNGLRMALSGSFDLVVLDIMLPLLDGMEVCKQIRKENASLPILMLTAKSEEIDKVLGLELGADDYLTKPFSFRELIARVKALLRRSTITASAESQEDSEISHGDLLIDLKSRKALLKGVLLDLTAKEWELLVLLSRNPGRTYSRQELLDLVWGYQYDGYSHTVNSHINRLRGKLEKDPAHPEYILTKRGMGYRFAESSSATGASL